MKIVNKVEEANCITHGSKFHADDIFSTVIMDKFYDDLKVVRVLNAPENLSENQMIYDIGGGKYDHHQKGGNGERENGIRYASFGLIWRDYGKEYLKKINVKDENIELVWKCLDEEFVQLVDSFDNGQFDSSKVDIPLVTVANIIELYNPKWNETISYDDCFIKAYNVAQNIWEEQVKSIVCKFEAKNIVDEIIKNSNEKYIVLNQYMPYQDFVINSTNPKAKEILYAIYPSNRGGYGIQAIRQNANTFENRKPFPEDWAGLTGEDLQKATGVDTAKFCHNSRFLCTTETLDDAILIAKKAIER